MEECLCWANKTQLYCFPSLPFTLQAGRLGWPVSVLLGHTAPVTFVDFCRAVPDALLSSSFDGTCRIWDARAGGAALHVLRASPAFAAPAPGAAAPAVLPVLTARQGSNPARESSGVQNGEGFGAARQGSGAAQGQGPGDTHEGSDAARELVGPGQPSQYPGSARLPENPSAMAEGLSAGEPSEGQLVAAVGSAGRAAGVDPSANSIHTTSPNPSPHRTDVRAGAPAPPGVVGGAALDLLGTSGPPAAGGGGGRGDRPGAADAEGAGNGHESGGPEAGAAPNVRPLEGSFCAPPRTMCQKMRAPSVDDHIRNLYRAYYMCACVCVYLP